VFPLSIVMISARHCGDHGKLPEADQLIGHCEPPPAPQPQALCAAPRSLLSDEMD